MNTGTATGVPDTTPGIAIANHKTLGGYWRVTVQGKTFITKQVDYGPAGWTGKKVDFTVGALKKYKLKDPTGHQVTAVYLGKKRPTQLNMTGKAIPSKRQPVTPQLQNANAAKQAVISAVLAGPQGRKGQTVAQYMLSQLTG